MSSHPWWYIARASGVTAWVLLAGSMWEGVVVAWRRSRAPAQRIEMHRLLSGIAVLMTVVHVGALLLDHFADYGIIDLLLPLKSIYRPGPVGWGVVAFYLLVVVEVSSLLRRWLTPQRWRSIHLASYAMFATASIHFLSTGTDAYRWLPTSVSVALGAVIIATCVGLYARADRIRNERSDSRGAS